ncbi:DUF962 domain-containing protein [Pseudoalteromonas luteoviolacea]|uniref:DUF962 domain-containing protein n=1 Tax=Pseudoalteromonas luteoviolacea TaxID=43657 RepID=UPI001F47AE6C|nr:DUF962 domain-containing protein [Pseudoalteromonas luteoviolacea]MCF6437826.1 DUF962 domain-containing protein [Pseudoalteromonas luteoviolacea]
MARKFESFQAFYQFYLQEHQNTHCRRMHFVGSSLVIAILIAMLITQYWALLLALPICGYGFAWFGHFFYEHNKPATFQYPLYSFFADWVMFKDIITRKITI